MTQFSGFVILNEVKNPFGSSLIIAQTRIKEICICLIAVDIRLFRSQFDLNAIHQLYFHAVTEKVYHFSPPQADGFLQLNNRKLNTFSPKTSDNLNS
jgi:hypothetical protein